MEDLECQRYIPHLLETEAAEAVVKVVLEELAVVDFILQVVADLQLFIILMELFREALVLEEAQQGVVLLAVQDNPIAV